MKYILILIGLLASSLLYCQQYGFHPNIVKIDSFYTTAGTNKQIYNIIKIPIQNPHAITGELHWYIDSLDNNPKFVRLLEKSIDGGEDFIPIERDTTTLAGSSLSTDTVWYFTSELATDLRVRTILIDSTQSIKLENDLIYEFDR